MTSGTTDTTRILVVCLGNICRSPAGEAALREAAEAMRVDVEVDSAGMGPWHVDQPPHPQIRAAGRRADLDIDGRGRQIRQPDDLAGWDLILAMDRSNLAELQRLAPDLIGRMHLFRSFDPDADRDEVPDPYGLADSAYDQTISIARSGAAAIAGEIAGGRLP